MRINTPGGVSEDNWSKVISVGDQELKSLSDFSALIKSWGLIFRMHFIDGILRSQFLVGCFMVS